MDALELNKLINSALREDAVRQDITTNALIPSSQRSRAVLIVKEDAVLCGLSIVKKVFNKLGQHVRFQTRYRDGAKVKRNTVIAALSGRTRVLLTGERTALNFLGYLSGIATSAHLYVQQTKGTKAHIFDTRKTTPGLRLLEKYAVRCGGAHNHRCNLSELILIKDNHRSACHPQLTIAGSIRHIRAKSRKKLEIEVDNLIQFKEAISARPDIILLDNMNRAQLKEAVRLVRHLPAGKRPLLEASGGITIHNVAAVAQTGVNRISVGAITHSAKAINVSMELK